MHLNGPSSSEVIWRSSYFVMFMALGFGLFMISKELGRGTSMGQTIIGMVDSLQVVTAESRLAAARSDSNRVLIHMAMDSLVVEMRTLSKRNRAFQEEMLRGVTQKVDNVQASVDSVHELMPAPKGKKK